MTNDAPKKSGLMSRLFGGGVTASAPSPSSVGLKLNWWQRLKSGLARSSSSIGQGITDLFTKRRLDDDTLQDFEDVLIRADLGLPVASRIVKAVGKGRYGKEIEGEEVKARMERDREFVIKKDKTKNSKIASDRIQEQPLGMVRP